MLEALRDYDEERCPIDYFNLCFDCDRLKRLESIYEDLVKQGLFDAKVRCFLDDLLTLD